MLTHFSITQQGESHIRNNKPCQDFSSSKRIHIDRLNCDLIIAGIADGVGSCEYSQVGSETAVSTLLKCIEYNLQNKIPEMTDKYVLALLKFSFEAAFSKVARTAESMELPLVEFDSTLTGIIYDGANLWFGHIGDDGIVALYGDGEYEMITTRHKGEEAHSLFPLRETSLWQFGKAQKNVVSCVMMTDGVLDYCVDTECMKNRVYFPFLEPALTGLAESDEEVEFSRKDWHDFFSVPSSQAGSFRKSVTDDISFVVIQNSEIVKQFPEIQFDFSKWDDDTAKHRKEIEDRLYADYYAFKANHQAPSEQEKKDIAPSADTNLSTGSGCSARNGELCSETYDMLKSVIDAVCDAGASVRSYIKSRADEPQRNDTDAIVNLGNDSCPDCQGAKSD